MDNAHASTEYQSAGTILNASEKRAHKNKLINRKMSQPPSLAMPHDPALDINSSNISLQVPNLTVRNNQFEGKKLLKADKF